MKNQNIQPIALVIGANQGVGYQIAKELEAHGYIVYVGSRQLQNGEKAATEIGANAHAVQLDVTKLETIDEAIAQIEKEHGHLDIAQVELLLSYAKRFYKRQFLTRKVVTNNLLQELEDLLNTYFDGKKNVPTVQAIADQLNYSPNYLSDMLRSLTGLNAQQHIHQKLIEKSKELLSTTNQTVNEVAYQLGFEHPQSFTRLFKIKTAMSPVQFRASFN